MRYDFRLRTVEKVRTRARYVPRPDDPRREALLRAHTRRIREAERRLREMGLDPTRVPAAIADSLLQGDEYEPETRSKQ